MSTNKMAPIFGKLSFFRRKAEIYKENKEDALGRMQWRNRRYFMYSTIALIVGLGNAWRFPIVISMYGGGAFLIPYTIMVVFMAIPLTFMELGLGQYSGKGPLNVWILCPIAQGVGPAITLVCFLQASYYNVITAYCAYYFFSSFSSTLPWTTCNTSWSKEYCYSRPDQSLIFGNCVLKNGAEYCSKLPWQASTEHFWLLRVLGGTEGGLTDGIFALKWDLASYLFICSFITFLILCKGIQLVEKVSKFLIFYPCACGTLLLFVALLNDGVMIGLKLLLIPDFSCLSDIMVWMKAAEQMVFSMGLFTGVLITYGSYCPFRSPCNMDAITLNIIDYGSSLLFTLIIFCLLGVMSFKVGVKIENCIATGQPLLFVAMAEAVTCLDGPSTLWSIIFYSMLFSLALSTQYSLIACNLSVIYDKYPRTLRFKISVSAIVNFAVFVMGLILVTKNGTELLNIMESFLSGIVSGCLSFFETLTISWLYGVPKFTDDLHFMLGFRSSAYWQGCWFLSPVMALTYQVTNFLMQKVEDPVTYTILFGWLIFAAVVVLIVGRAFYNIFIYKRGKKESLLKPMDCWGPADPALIKSRRMFVKQAMTREYLYRQTRLGGRTRNEVLDEEGDDDDNLNNEIEDDANLPNDNKSKETIQS